MVNSAVGFEVAAYRRPCIEYVGPLLPLEIPTDISENSYHLEIFHWMDDCLDGMQGLAFVNFGHMSSLSEQFLYHVEEGLDGFCLLWAVPPELLDMDFFSRRPPSHPQLFVSSRDELPYWQILASDKIDFVVSHCGMASAQEAILYKKPILCITFFGDQSEIASRVTQTGAGVHLYYKDLSLSANIKSSAFKIRTNLARYKASLERLSKFLQVRGVGTTVASDIVEEVLAGGYVELSRVDVYPGWDIVALCLSILTIFLMFIRIVVLFSKLLFQKKRREATY